MTDIDSQPNPADLTSYKGKEKRSATRLDANAYCSMEFEDSHSLTGDIINISFTGAFVAIEHDDPESFVNLRIWLDFSLLIRKNDYPLRVSGTIVRATDQGLGIAFRSSEHNRIQTIIETLEEEIEELQKSLTDHGQSFRN